MVAAACHRSAKVSSPAPAPTRAPAPARAADITTGESLVQAMHDRYARTWYKTLTFTQSTTVGLPSGGTLAQTWYEAMMLPSRLRIDTDLPSKGAGVLFAHDSIYRFSAGKQTSVESGLNELLVLGFDVYTQPATATLSDLRKLGFDLGRLHESTWEGRTVYVVGAARGDTMSKQFWVDRDRLLFVRMLDRGRQGHTDVRFDHYVQTGGGWVATEVTQYVAGKRRLHEEYSDVRPNVSLSPALFDPREFTTAPHWVKP
jgi:hypothetical protein